MWTPPRAPRYLWGVKKPPQAAPAKVGQIAESRPQKTQPVADSARVKPTPRTKADADSRLMGGDDEQAKVVQDLDPPRRLNMPGDLKEPTAHGHSPEIAWSRVDAGLPFKNLK